MKQIKLTIGGEERTFYFGLGFLGNLLDKEGISVVDIDTKINENPFKWIPTLMFRSCEFGYLRKGEFAPFDLFDFSEWIDELGIDSDVVKSFFEGFKQSLVKDVPQQEAKEDKKKETKK